MIVFGFIVTIAILFIILPIVDWDNLWYFLLLDLIVIGSHGRHGLALLLGSTANSVLHHARCDVLAVRLQNQ